MFDYIFKENVSFSKISFSKTIIIHLFDGCIPIDITQKFISYFYKLRENTNQEKKANLIV